MSKIEKLILISLLLILPLNTFAQDDVVSCSSEGECIEPEPYIPTECELRMWDVYSAADLAVQDILKLPICEELVNSWTIGVDDSGSGEAFNTVSDIAEKNNNGKARKVVVSKRKLRNLKRQAKSCK